MFAASAGILLAAWMGYRRYGVPSAATHPGMGASRSGRTTVGWAMPDGSASHSDTISGEAADTLGQTRRENLLRRYRPRPCGRMRTTHLRPALSAVSQGLEGSHGGG